MNEYFLKATSENESLHHTIDFEVRKNESLFWKVRRYTGRKMYRIETSPSGEIEVIRKWLLYPLLDVVENGNPLYRINNKICKYDGKKIYKDRRGFIYEGNELICSLDSQSRGWNEDKSIILKWRHEYPQYEKIIAILALLP